MDDCITSNDKTLLDKIGTREPPTRSQRSMADEARLASALTGVTERLDAHDDAHEADDDGVSLTRSEDTKHLFYHTLKNRWQLRVPENTGSAARAPMGCGLPCAYSVQLQLLQLQIQDA